VQRQRVASLARAVWAGAASATGGRASSPEEILWQAIPVRELLAGRLLLEPRKLAAACTLMREMVEAAPVDGERMVEQALRKAAASLLSTAGETAAAAAGLLHGVSPVAPATGIGAVARIAGALRGREWDAWARFVQERTELRKFSEIGCGGSQPALSNHRSNGREGSQPALFAP
jgi:hypothetical protein